MVPVLITARICSACKSIKTSDCWRNCTETSYTNWMSNLYFTRIYLYIFTSLCNPRITSSFTAVQNVFLNTTYSGLSFGIMELKGSFKRLKKKQHRSSETNIGFRGYCGWLKTVRSKLRFHNCSVLTGDLDGHRPVQGQLGVQLTEEDIFQSHPIGKSNRNGNIQIICRFKYRRWRTMFF